jgi:hypothetical protein
MFNKHLNRFRLTLTAAALGLASVAGPLLLPPSAHAATTTPHVTAWTNPPSTYRYYVPPEKLYLSGSYCNDLTVTGSGFVTRNAWTLVGLDSLGGNPTANPTNVNSAWAYQDNNGTLQPDQVSTAGTITISANGKGSPGYYVVEVYDDGTGTNIYSNADYCS